MKIIVVGDGKWGSAIGSLLSENGREFSFWKKGDDLPDQAILIMCIPTQAIRALELASAFKNVYAIACGVAEGLGFKTNTRVKLILLAIEEFYRLSRKLGYTIDRRALPGTIGDLILTCNSEESRNFSFGKLLAKHKKGEALSLIGETVEGYSSVESVPYFEEHSRINLPLARFAYEIIREDDPAFVRSGFSDFVKNS